MGIGRNHRYGGIVAAALAFFVLFINEFNRVEIILLIIIILIILFIISYFLVKDIINQEIVVIDKFIGILLVCVSPFYINEIVFFVLTVIIFEINSGINLFPKRYFINKTGLIKIIGLTLINSIYTSIIIHILTAGWRILSFIFLFSN